ncbi:prolyl oligopeptidase family serine peptidase [Pedobacter sp. LMG 31464]|uniref:Prolyl oligopeptidase family serine peptidase n=1 Tax=Pedobacter planticolens TaxID=2679964 RepID=A0A923DYS7_9SPHI|nr:prolyl oligopeptidase family serine peptidase [Pedobacter planticolens]MBB2145600.1 prolyl oligopeptidase family serine peptidase [Pedobacter planticolens]
MKKTILFLLLLFTISTGFAQDLSKYKKENFIQGTDTLKYRILYPENFDATKKYPVVFFLHGSGERGNDNEKQLTHGGKLFLTDNFRETYPTIVIFPQCAEDNYWSNVEIEEVSGKRFFTFQKGGEPTKPMALLLKLTDQFVNQSFVNKSKVYVGGLSMGGMGTFEILRRRTKTFAAAFAICGGDNIQNVKKYQHVPLWIFHGRLDDVVAPQFSFNIYRELKKLGHEPKFTIYPKANHNSWDSAFAEPNLLPWLFSNQK